MGRTHVPVYVLCYNAVVVAIVDSLINTWRSTQGQASNCAYHDARFTYELSERVGETLCA